MLDFSITYDIFSLACEMLVTLTPTKVAFLPIGGNDTFVILSLSFKGD